MRYSLGARSYKGRSTSKARLRRTWTRSARRPGRRASFMIDSRLMMGTPRNKMIIFWPTTQIHETMQRSHRQTPEHTHDVVVSVRLTI